MTTWQDVFVRACTRVLDCWTALNLAVQNNWGGDDSFTKKENLVNTIIEYCLKNKNVYSDEIEDILADKIDENFSVTLEDGSEVEIASILVKLHSTCSNNDFTYADQLLNTLNKCPTPCVSEQDSNSEDEEIERPRNGTRGPKMVIDEDGWTTVL